MIRKLGIQPKIRSVSQFRNSRQTRPPTRAKFVLFRNLSNSPQTQPAGAEIGYDSQNAENRLVTLIPSQISETWYLGSYSSARERTIIQAEE